MGHSVTMKWGDFQLQRPVCQPTLSVNTSPRGGPCVIVEDSGDL